MAAELSQAHGLLQHDQFTAGNEPKFSHHVPSPDFPTASAALQSPVTMSSTTHAGSACHSKVDWCVSLGRFVDPIVTVLHDYIFILGASVHRILPDFL